MHDFNRLMSAMSIDGIWQNNLITLFLRLDRSLALPSLLAEAWLVKEASAILPASVFSCMSNSPMRANLHAWRITLSHKSTTCVRCTDRSNAQQNGQLSIRRASDRSLAAVASQRQSLTACTYSNKTVPLASLLSRSTTCTCILSLTCILCTTCSYQ